jgi:hypothetical protein
VPGPLDQLEHFMEEAVEGTVQKLFRPKLQPVQIAKAAAREMEQQQVVGPAGLEVPNSYAISLHPKDFERFARFQLALQRELEKYLLRYAVDRGWRPISGITVMLAADSTAPVGRPKVVAQMADMAGDVPGAEVFEAPIERTVRQSRVAPPSAESGPLEAPPAMLVGADGERFALRRAVNRIGRALENEIVIADARVSRFHAEIRRQDGSWVLHDLGSTNGTMVADTAVDSVQLDDRARISLGGYQLVFREGTARAEAESSLS